MAQKRGRADVPESFGPFPEGMDNIAPDYAIPDGRVRSVVNADITDGGNIKRRKGFVQVAAATNITSAWDNRKEFYFVDDGTLKHAVPGATGQLDVTTVTNAVGADLGRAAAFADVAGTTVISDSLNLYAVSDVGSKHLVNFSYPAPNVLSVSAGAGDSAFLIAATGALEGSETAPSPVFRVVGGYPLTINLASYPFDVNVYVSTPDGRELYFVAKSGGTTVIVNSTDARKRPLMTTDADALPAGTMLRYAFGRLFSVVGPVAFYSMPFYPAVYSPVEGFIPMPDDFTVFEPLLSGIVVATDKEIAYLEGTDFGGNFEYKTLANYGAVPGTAIVADTKESVYFMTPKGEVMVSASLTDTGERLVNLHEGKVAVDIADHGAVGRAQHDGVDKIITSLFNANLSRTGVSSFMDAEIVRKGVTL